MHVLVVDDNPDAADTFAALLRAWGHNADVVYSGRDALNSAAHSFPDAALLDLNMPGLDGFATAERLCRVAGPRKLLLVALTSYSDTTTRELAGEVAFDEFVVKTEELGRLQGLLRDFDRHGR
jgi:two-component system, chemotaxis family, CheB/CheR fusion protein